MTKLSIGGAEFVLGAPNLGQLKKLAVLVAEAPPETTLGWMERSAAVLQIALAKDHPDVKVDDSFVCSPEELLPSMRMVLDHFGFISAPKAGKAEAPATGASTSPPSTEI